MSLLTQLPDELIDAIAASSIHPKDVFSLSQTCRRLYSIAYPNVFKLGHRDYDRHLLQWAARHGNESVAQHLIGNMGQIANRGAEEWVLKTPLDEAVEAGHVSMTAMLLKHATAEALSDTIRWLYGRELLLKAMRKNDYDTVRLLLENGAKPDQYACDGYSPLVTAVRHDNPTMFRFLLENQIYTERIFCNGGDGRGITWQRGCDSGHAEIVELMLKYGAIADVANDEYVWRHMFQMIRRVDCAESVRVLLEHGASPRGSFEDWPSSNQTLLIAAIHTHHEDFIDVLLDFGANPYETDAQSGSTPLAEAVAESNDGALHRLLVRGIDPNTSMRHGHTAMSIAIRKRNWWAVEELLSFGAEVKPFKGREADALQGSAELGLCRLGKILLDRGEDANMENTEGRCLMCIAASHGQEEFVQFLLSYGADPAAGLEALETSSPPNHQREQREEVFTFLKGIKC